ncbi:hypothetical protein PMAYCL1PPCAC_20809, partial [Pristionchus mayeri]
KPLCVDDNDLYRARFRKSVDSRIVENFQNNGKVGHEDRYPMVLSGNVYMEMTGQELCKYPFGRMFINAIKENLHLAESESKQLKPSEKNRERSSEGTEDDDSDSDGRSKKLSKRKKKESTSDWSEEEGRELLKRRKNGKALRKVARKGKAPTSSRETERENEEDQEEDGRVAPQKPRRKPNKKETFTLKSYRSIKKKVRGNGEEKEEVAEMPSTSSAWNKKR